MPSNLEGGPVKNELYVVCGDLSIRSVYEPSRLIGWELIEDGDVWYYRVTQIDHPRKRCAVRFHGHTDDPPVGRWRTVEQQPQNAEITTQKDDGEPEVRSDLKDICG